MLAQVHQGKESLGTSYEECDGRKVGEVCGAWRARSEWVNSAE